jgi:hypothetical protein
MYRVLGLSLGFRLKSLIFYIKYEFQHIKVIRF